MQRDVSEQPASKVEATKSVEVSNNVSKAPDKAVSQPGKGGTWSAQLDRDGVTSKNDDGYNYTLQFNPDSITGHAGKHEAGKNEAATKNGDAGHPGGDRASPGKSHGGDKAPAKTEGGEKAPPAKTEIGGDKAPPKTENGDKTPAKTEGGEKQPTAKGDAPKSDQSKPSDAGEHQGDKSADRGHPENQRSKESQEQRDGGSQPGKDPKASGLDRPPPTPDQPAGRHKGPGEGERREGGSETLRVGGHGDKKDATTSKSELDYATFLSDQLNPAGLDALLDAVRSVLGHNDTVTTGGLSFGIGAKSNVSEAGQGVVVAANILFTFLDSIIAAGKVVIGEFSNKNSLYKAVLAEVKAGRIPSETLSNVFVNRVLLSASEERAAKAFGTAIVEGKTPGQAGTIAHDVAGANLHAESGRYGQMGASPIIKPGPDFIEHGGATARELKFHAGYMTPEQFQRATAQTMADNIVYQQATGLAKLRLPTVHIYVDLRTGEVAKFIQRF